MTKTFEERFPSLKGKGMYLEKHVHRPTEGTCRTEHYVHDPTQKTGCIFASSTIERYLLDKMKVCEAIDEFVFGLSNGLIKEALCCFGG